MDKKEMDKMRSSVLYEKEVLKVICTLTNGQFSECEIEVFSRACRHSMLPYPQPKWVACDYYVYDLDGDKYSIAKDRYGELTYGFEWVR